MSGCVGASRAVARAVVTHVITDNELHDEGARRARGEGVLGQSNNKHQERHKEGCLRAHLRRQQPGREGKGTEAGRWHLGAGDAGNGLKGELSADRNVSQNGTLCISKNSNATHCFIGMLSPPIG